MALTQADLNALYGQMSVYGDTYQRGQNLSDVSTSSDTTGIAPIILPPIAGGGGGGGNEENINRNIDYNNLIVRNQNLDPNIMRIANYDEIFGEKKFTDDIAGKLTVESPERFSFPIDKKSNIFTDAINKFKSYTDNNKTLKGILNASSIIRDPIAGALSSFVGMLPKQDPRGTALKDFYGDNFDLTSTGSVASGIMKGYNPISGGFLNTITGGKYGDEIQYGLTPAIDKRIAKINETLKKYDKYKYGSEAFDKDKYNQQIEKIKKLEAIKQKEAEATATAAAAVERARLEKLARQNPGFDPSGPTQRTIRAERPDKSGATGTRAGGFTNPGANSYGPHMAKGGIVTL